MASPVKPFQVQQTASFFPAFHLAMRKYVAGAKVQYWLLVKGLSKPKMEDDDFLFHDSKKPFVDLYLGMIHSTQWISFMVFTVVLSSSLFFSYYWWSPDQLRSVLITMTLTCVFYWVDFIGSILHVRRKKRYVSSFEEPKKMVFLIIDAISLMPISEFCMMIDTEDNDRAWKLRAFTLLRLYRIRTCFTQLSTARRSHWKILLCHYGCYFTVFCVMFGNSFLYDIKNYSRVKIVDWNSTTVNRIIVSSYYVTQMVLNVSFGDIKPKTHLAVVMNSAALLFGSVMTTGVLTGILATSFVNKWKRREQCRFEYDATVNTLKERRTDIKTLEKVLENMSVLWKYRKGYLTSPKLDILPMSLKKELLFDINFGLLHRSLVFSSQPRAFLRSVTVLMKNVSYLPGDIILEPYDMVDLMICILSGVVEVLSEENDETPLFSLTTGTILGEASLFLSIPTKCIVRASTYVELQVLSKNEFSRLALTYPEIFRAMRLEVHSRIGLLSNQAFFGKNYDSDVKELSRRKETKKFLKKLRGFNEATAEKYAVYKKGFLNLYVLSENIPKVKTLPVNLIKKKPWILRPDTPLRLCWDAFIMAVATIYAVALPVWTVFFNGLETYMTVYIVVANIIFIIDVYIEITTAVEKKDGFTYITSIKDILSYKLKKVGFYLDVLATFYVSVYVDIVTPENHDFGYLLLSMNGVLKVWRLPTYIRRAENSVKRNLLIILICKFVIFYVIIMAWAAFLLELVACPLKICISDRWMSYLESIEDASGVVSRLTDYPMTLSLYFGTCVLFTVGFGDVVVHSIPDCVAVIFLMLVGDFTINISMAQASSVFKHLERLKTDYQEELFAVDDLMGEHDIPEIYRVRVKNYLRVQWEYDKGYSLKRTTLNEVLPTLQKRIIMISLMKAFSSVPFFRECNPDFLKLLSKISRVRVLPPFEDIAEAGSMAREMYILENGYCEAWLENEVGKKKVLGPMNIIAAYEMITGKPQPLNVRTVTHARIISLSYNGYLRAVTKYPSVKVHIDNFLKTQSHFETVNAIKPLVTPQSFKAMVEKQRQIMARAFINVYKYHKTLSVPYWEPFNNWGRFRYFQFMFLPYAILPNSLFIKIWMSIRLAIVAVVGMFVPIWFSIMGTQGHVKHYILFVQICCVIDMYLMFHLAYYDSSGLLIFHPAKTAVWYIKGTFFVDLVALCPVFWVIDALLKHRKLLSYVNAVGFIMILQFYKFFQICAYLEHNILVKTDQIKIFKYVPLVLIVINFIAGGLILVQCSEVWTLDAVDYNIRTILDTTLKERLKHFCTAGYDYTYTFQDTHEGLYLYLIVLYWVTESLLGCGYGDVVAYNFVTMIMVILIVIVGLFFFTFLFASITGSMVNTGVLITQYRRRILRMMKFMKSKNVSHELQKRLFKHYEYNWYRTEGVAPQQIFTFVHLALREKIFASMYGPTVHRNEIFRGVEKQIISIIGKNLNAVYFLKGETIVKFNDIQKYVYIVYKGEVNVIRHDGLIIETMRNGGVFGNISNKFYSLSTEKIVAADNVDLLQIDAKIFFNTLKVFPKTAAVVSALEGKTENYVSANADSDEDLYAGRYINIYHPSWANKSFKSYDSNLNGHFYFYKSIFKGHGFLSYIILPDSILIKFIENVFLLCYITNASITLYMFSFQNFELEWFVLAYVMDFMFIIEILIRLHTTYVDKTGNCLIDVNKTRSRYYLSRKIVFDCAAAAPVDLFGFGAVGIWRYKCVTLLRLNRMAKLYDALLYFKRKKAELMINKIQLTAGWMSLSVILLIHFICCLWYFGTCPMGVCEKVNWKVHSYLENVTHWDIYFHTSFFSLILVTSTGYQVLEVCRPREIMLVIFFMIVCRFIVVLLSSVFVAGINAQNLNLFKFQDRISELIASFTRQNLSNYQMTKLCNYLTLLWQGEMGKQMPKFIVSAPYALKCEVMNEMFGFHLADSYFFHGLNEALIRQMACRMKRYMYYKGNYIVYQGDIDGTMYFIHAGEVLVLTIHPDLLDSVHFTLSDGDLFGMKQGLIQGYAHNFTYRAESTVEIITLNYKEWEELLVYFPHDAAEIYKRLDALPPEATNVK